jgi:hypothetical protein
MSSDISSQTPLIQNTHFSMDWFGPSLPVKETVHIPSHWMIVDLNAIAPDSLLGVLVNIVNLF